MGIDSSFGRYYIPVYTRPPRTTLTRARTSAVRYVLGTLLAFGALNAFAGAGYGLAGAKGIPTKWLAGSPFTDYFIPSLVLLVVVGGSLAFAALAVFACWRSARPLAFGAAAIVLGWLVVQVSILGFVSWLQPMTTMLAVGTLILAWLLPRPGVASRGKVVGRR